ncbi:MAG: alpha/beta fold hydrolase [Anaerovoracaceae bacterium]
MYKFHLQNNKDAKAYLWTSQRVDCIMIIIHGIGEYAGRYDRLAMELLKSNITVLSADLPGHGETIGVRGHAAPREEVFNLVDELINDAKKGYPNVPIVLYGHSMGGNIVLDYRCRGEKLDDLAAFIVSAPWVELCQKPSKFLQKFLKLASKIVPRMTIDTGIKADTLGNFELIKNYDIDTLVHRRISLKTALEGFEIGEDLRDDILKVKPNIAEKPFLLMHGDKDKICSVEGSRAIKRNNKENCEYIEWKGLYHEIHNGGKESDGSEVIQKITDWILSNLIKK